MLNQDKSYLTFAGTKFKDKMRLDFELTTLALSMAQLCIYLGPSYKQLREQS